MFVVIVFERRLVKKSLKLRWLLVTIHYKLVIRVKWLNIFFRLILLLNILTKKPQTDRREAPPVVGKESIWEQRNTIPEDLRCLRVRLQAKTVIFDTARVALLQISMLCFYHIIILSGWEYDWCFGPFWVYTCFLNGVALHCWDLRVQLSGGGGDHLYGIYSWPVCVYVLAEKATLCSTPLYVQLFLFGVAFCFNENWGSISIAWDAGTTHPMGEPLFSPCFALSGSFIFVVLSFSMKMFLHAFNVLIGSRLGSNQHWWGGSTV